MGKREERVEEAVVKTIKKTSEKFGQLYPVLVDFHNEVIDGEHRRVAIVNPKTFKVSGIKTKKDRLEARLVANHARKGQHKSTWVPTLTDLGKLLEQEGVDKIGMKIAEETGLPYTTIMRYLPQEFKNLAQSDRASHPRLPNGSPEIESEIPLAESLVESPAKLEEKEIPLPTIIEKNELPQQPLEEIIQEYRVPEDQPKPRIRVQKFSNQPWKAILIPKDFMDKLERTSEKRNVDIQEAITLALMKLLEDLRGKKGCLQESQQ